MTMTAQHSDICEELGVQTDFACREFGNAANRRLAALRVKPLTS